MDSTQMSAGTGASAGTPSPGPAEARPCLVVGIGASAGGQVALEHIFTAIPPDCGMSFVVLMHLPPDGPSFLAEMLGRYTTMAVATAEEGMRLTPNTVHVIPAGRELTLADGVLRLQEPDGRHHPIDRFLRSLATEAGKHAVAVVLSGFGTDGTEGVKAVKEAGGIVIVQEPGSAVNPSMPRSAITRGAADLIVPAEEMAEKIAELALGTCALPDRACAVTTMDEELREIFNAIKAKTGHDFSSYKRNTVIRRIERRMAVNDVAGMKKYIDLLEANEQEAQALGQEILIGVTSFFRDPDAFDVLRKEIIPRLFAGRAPDEPVRIWHACCASGEEVYSTAILIREYLNEQRLNVAVQFFATDIDEAAIAQARAGLYDDDIVEEVGEERLKRFFTRVNGRWQAAKQLREMIVFAHHSVIKDPPFSRLDLLVCRNFLIYLNPDMQKRLISLFHLVLKPRGVLFLGASETVGRQSEFFAPLDKKWKIYERLESVRRDEPIFPYSASVRRLPGIARPSRPETSAEPNGGALAERLLMERYAPPCVVVNEKYEVVHVSTRASRLLEVPVGEPTRDILKMTREELRPALRAAIYKSFSEEKQVAFRGIKFAIDETEAAVNVLVEPLSVPSAEKLAMVILEPAPAAPMIEAPDGELGHTGTDASKDSLIHQLEEQLRITHEQLHATAEQLETSQEGFMSANEELMSINEEFQSANEELQSTNEELETSKEELQALNEELVTVNAELHGKVEELDQANSDMENLLTSSEIATLFLDRQFTIKRFTPAMAQVLNLIAADVGRPFRHLAGTIDWPGLSGDAATVLETLSPIEREVAGVENGHSYLMRVLPYRTPSGGVDGVVVTLVDITEHKRLDGQIRHLASFPQLNPNPVLEVSSAGTITYVNPATERALETLGMRREDHAVFLPDDLADIVSGWDRQAEATFYREITIREIVFGETIFLSPRFDAVRIYAYDITERKRTDEERETTVEFLRLVNESRGTTELVRSATTFFQERSGCEAVGIRLREGDDYPYHEARGFTQEFLLLENSLCTRDGAGEIVRDTVGNPVFDCMCGNVICGRFDPAKPFFTTKGSFWSNCTTELLASTSEADRQARTRNRCNGEGYESVALIPLRLGEERLGLLQLNDRQKGRFTSETVALWERLADYLAVALAKFRADEALHESEKRYHSLFDNMLEGFAYCRMLYDEQNSPVDFVYLDVNNAFGRLTGLENVQGKKVTEVIPGIRESSQDLFEIYGRVALTGQPEKFEIEFKPLSAWFSISVYSIERGYFVAVFDDITEHKRAEEEIRRHVEELQAINEELTRFNNASVGREMRMIELKKEINEICVQVGQQPRYPLEFEK
jgi:two-component system, chemotaxis family, CheB/CheR fusion protein